MLPELSDHFPVIHRFCYPDWLKIGDTIEQTLESENWDEAWYATAEYWVGQIATELGEPYQVYETQNFLIVTEAPKRVVKHLKKTCEGALKHILKSLHGAAVDEGFGKHVVFLFADIDDYYEYILHFYEDRETNEFPMSGGICIHGSGYTHFALLTTDYSQYSLTLVHELTHVCLSHLPIPLWINEALAMRMEGDEFWMDAELYDRHQEHWNKETIQQFWSGESWQIPGESFELSYSLAKGLWRKLEFELKAPQALLMSFVNEANREDAGVGAFGKYLGFEMEELVLDFLGEGDWKPDPNQWSLNTVNDLPL